MVFREEIDRLLYFYSQSSTPLPLHLGFEGGRLESHPSTRVLIGLWVFRASRLSCQVPNRWYEVSFPAPCVPNQACYHDQPIQLSLAEPNAQSDIRLLSLASLLSVMEYGKNVGYLDQSLDRADQLEAFWALRRMVVDMGGRIWPQVGW